MATRRYPSSPESRASRACFDLDAFVSEESGSSQGYSQTSMVGRNRKSVSSGTSSVDEQSDLSCELNRFQPLNSPVSPISDIGSQNVVEPPSHYEAPDVPVAALALFDTVSHMSHVSALSSVMLSPNRVCVDCPSRATDVFPIYQVSPGNTGYLPATSPVTPPIPDCLPIPPGFDFLPTGSFDSLIGLDLLDQETDLLCLSAPLLPLPDDLLILPVPDSRSTSHVCQLLRRPPGVIC